MRRKFHRAGRLLATRLRGLLMIGWVRGLDRAIYGNSRNRLRCFRSARRAGSIRYSRIANIGMDLEPQEPLVLSKVSAHPERKFTFAALAQELSMSAAEVHASVKRAAIAGLATVRGRGDRAPVRRALLEFAIHGARHAFPRSWGPASGAFPRHMAPSRSSAFCMAAAETSRCGSIPRGAFVALRFRRSTARRRMRRLPIPSCIACGPCWTHSASAAPASANWRPSACRMRWGRWMPRPDPKPPASRSHCRGAGRPAGAGRLRGRLHCRPAADRFRFPRLPAGPACRRGLQSASATCRTRRSRLPNQ